ncbi:tRNA (cytosine(32)/uridine(32)-2'-O)-methyltransferase TrmJ [Psychrobium sp. 1_MG-2023]|uniref:tRNA (cytosine(32)/uridine(32)-2'-O)-methyltransferase TrmJ n=1 Tax=Psychrobium sp. 1_MG-2023 TaxID=3062624 RepID=UPI000C32C800|nr:tRNA (cytosine(32)/uridine(32)-2'-O)-methyltransferase TrmJ [Psychrobium sp. 1_MG-2023]MDP2560561.1 tRNA (cytosine(32)/uridine(32)-2'-O)-methyltransferase TrmJ [Psychrobium sp. 1_MG-2023]PKF57634.1 tRNA (cytosine(32)/uridine(32)-2'-O)-methyltransferase TrmJ [Alteromonadales bacterium alter-6D02]
MLPKVKVVLVGTTHPGNIGSVARAMKTMGLSDLVLVDPQTEIDEKSHALASGARDVLSEATIVDTLEEAVADCGLVVGSSARSRTLPWPMLDPRECGIKLMSEVGNYPVAVVFGRENSGLTNEELQLCQFHVCIPANPEYSSLNLAMAVQTICYEIRMAALTEIKPVEEAYPDSAKLEGYYAHLEDTLNDIGFIVKAHPGQVMTKLRRLYNRARPEEVELNILRGILTATQRGPNNKQTKD